MAVNSIQDVYSSIFSYINNNYTETPVAYDNSKYEPELGNEYVSAYVDLADEVPRSINGSQIRYENVGELVFAIYTEQGKLPGRNAEIGDILASLFRGKSIDGIQFRGASYRRVGILDGGSWYRGNLRIEFYANIYQ